MKLVSPYRCAPTRAAAPASPWWRWLRAFTVPWEMERRRQRLARKPRMIEIRAEIERLARSVRPSIGVAPCEHCKDRAALLHDLIGKLRELYLTRRRPWLARGTRPPIGGFLHWSCKPGCAHCKDRAASYFWVEL